MIVEARLHRVDVEDKLLVKVNILRPKVISNCSIAPFVLVSIVVHNLEATLYGNMLRSSKLWVFYLHNYKNYL